MLYAGVSGVAARNPPLLNHEPSETVTCLANTSQDCKLPPDNCPQQLPRLAG